MIKILEQGSVLGHGMLTLKAHEGGSRTSEAMLVYLVLLSSGKNCMCLSQKDR